MTTTSNNGKLQAAAHNNRKLQAAAQLEDTVMELKDIIIELRKPTMTYVEAHKLVYNVRRDMGKILKLVDPARIRGI